MNRIVLALVLLLLGPSPAGAHPDPDSMALWGRLIFEAPGPAERPTAVRVETFSATGPAERLAASLELFQGLARTRLRLDPAGHGIYTGRLGLSPGFWQGVVRFERDGRWLFGDFGFRVDDAGPPRQAIRFGTRQGGPFTAPPWLDHLGWVSVVGAILVLAPLLARRPERAPAPRPRLGVPGWGIGLATLGALAGPLGAHWDVAWHVDRGRETFWSPPHLVIYGGIVAVLIALLAGVATLGGPARRALWRHPGLRFTLIASAVVLGSAPFDQAWHALFGLDVSIWSPPHLALLFGSAFSLLGLAILQGERIAEGGGRLAQLLLFATALLVIGLFTHEFEYAILERWHVLQGRPPGLYPLASSILSALILTAAARVGRRPGTASLVALIAWTLRILVSHVVLPALGRTAPLLPPPWLLPALALDGVLLLARGERRGLVFALGGLAATTAAYLAHNPMAGLLAGKPLGAAELWTWFPLALAASAAAGYLGFRIGELVEAPRP